MKIIIQNIILNYFKIPALVIDRLEFFRLGVIGKSGSGKTNLIKVLCGLEEIESGEIYIGVNEVGVTKPKDREIALLSDNTPLFRSKSVFYNLKYALKKRRMGKNDIRARVFEIANEFDLGELNKKVKDLSEEEIIRVLVARAFVRRPMLLLVDEPVLFLDNVDYFYETLQKALSNYNSCVCFCTFDFDAIKDLCDKFIVLDKGQIIFEGNLEEMKNCPDKFVRSVCFL